MRRVRRLISAAEYSEWMMIDFGSDFSIGGEEIVSTRPSVAGRRPIWPPS
jgi:hypothetical protein